jgi:hypothetical protein
VFASRFGHCRVSQPHPSNDKGREQSRPLSLNAAVLIV